MMHLTFAAVCGQRNNGLQRSICVLISKPIPLRWGNYPWFFRWTQYNRQGSYKKKAGGLELAEDVMAETDFGLIKEEAMSQRTRAVSRSQKWQENSCPLKPVEGAGPANALT